MKRAKVEAGLRSRLLALVLVPMLLVGGLTWSMVQDRRDRASAAREVRSGIDEITSLVGVTRQLLLARSPVEIEVRAQELGLPPERALELLNLDEASFGDLRGLADLLRGMPVSLRPFPPGQIDRLAAAVEDGPTLAELQTFDDLQDQLDVHWDRRIAMLRADIVALGDPDLAQVADDLTAASDAGSATAYLLMGLSDHWFSSLAESEGADAARIRLGAPAQKFDDAVAALEASSDPSVASIALELDELRSSGRFGAAIDDALADRPPAPLAGGKVDLGELAATFTDAFTELEPLLALVQGRTDALETEADRVADSSAHAADLALVAMAALTAAVLLLSIGVTASFLRPLRRLIDAMQEVGRGDLSGQMLTTGGPPEVSAASSAFNDVLLNLRLLEAKVEALARGDLDDPWLHRSLPGALGQQLEESVEVLAGSIAERSQLQERLEHQATHDPLTGIANRAGALDALEGAVARAHRHGSVLAVAFLDLDGFKQVNDRYGHASGDAVLIEVGRRLVAEARTGDTCARMGGDEFIVIAEQMGSARDAKGMGLRISEALAAPIVLPDGMVATIGASIGIALTDAPNEPPSALLHRADLAAYSAKRAGAEVHIAPEQLIVLPDEPVVD